MSVTCYGLHVPFTVVAPHSLTLSPAQNDTPPQSSTCLWDAAGM